MLKKYVVKQDGYKDCASACLLSILRYYNADYSKEELAFLIKQDRTGTNAFNLLSGIKQIGLDGYAVKVEIEELKNTEITFPVIAHIKLKNYYHFVVIYKIKKDKIIVMDPSIGIKTFSIKEFKQMFLGNIIIIYPIKSLPNSNNKNLFLKLLIKNIIINKKQLIYIIILSLFSIIFTIINNFYYKIIIDYNFKNLKFIYILTIIFILFTILKNLFTYFKEKIIINFNYLIDSFINNYVVKHILLLPYNYFKNKSTSEVMVRIKDLEYIKEFITKFVLSLSLNLLLALITLVVLYFINLKLFLISILMIALYFIISFIYSKIFKNKIYNLQMNNEEYNKTLEESIYNFETIRNLNILNLIRKKLEFKYYYFLKKEKKFNKLYLNSMIFKNFINDIGIISILMLGSILIIENILSLGDLITFIFLLSFFTEPIKQLIDLEPNLRYAKSSYQRINELLKIKTIDYQETKQQINGDIEVKNLSYSYNNIDYIIQNKSFLIKKGGRYLIQGSSGSGKSTFIKILLKYLNEYKGNILVNNQNLLDIDFNTINNSFLYVSQNEGLFTQTLEENILLDRNLNKKKVREILKICKVDQIIDSKKLRKHFFIEENGFNLSGGERQRIVLARALLKEFNYIIIDEALSEVNNDYEKEIINNIFSYFKDKTIIYISHNELVKNLFKNHIKLERR